jgi:hypothetical protein
MQKIHDITEGASFKYVRKIAWEQQQNKIGLYGRLHGPASNGRMKGEL